MKRYCYAAAILTTCALVIAGICGGHASEGGDSAPHYTFENPVWSPDGQSIAFQRVELLNGSLAPPYPPRSIEVWVMKDDGSGKRRLKDFPFNKKFSEYVEILGWTDDGSGILVSHTKRDVNNVPGLDFELRQSNGLWVIPVSGNRSPFLWDKGYIRGRIIGSHGGTIGVMEKVTFVSAGEGVYWEGLSIRSLNGKTLRSFPGVKLHTGYTPMYYNDSSFSHDGKLIAWTVDSSDADVVIQGVGSSYKKIIPPIKKKDSSNITEIISVSGFSWARTSCSLLLYRYTGLGLFDLSSGREKALQGVPPGAGVSLSPDDRSLCFSIDGRLSIYDIKSGTSKKLFENQKSHEKEAVMLWPLCWRKNPPERILACVQVDSYAQSEDSTPGQYVICSLSPDGKESHYLTDLKELPPGK